MAREWYSNLKQEPYSKWHRKFEGIAMIDVDSVEVCPHCTQPLAFIELAKDTGQKFKAYTLTKKLADKFEIPGFVVFYKTDDKNEIIKYRVQRVSPVVGLINNNVKPDDWLKYLKQIQKEHGCRLKIDDENWSYGGTI
tara:strand:- start:265 stop:678 length:414 start_codon:yes stop_codon:yes gene_type:complete